jgi:RNA polymerase sigma-70 factor (ECF subfamily)
MREDERRSAEEVLAEFAWVRRLSLRLCSDAASADDLTQEVLLAGVAQPPRDGIPVRRWLAGIARRKARMAARSAARRAFHERSVTESHAQAGTQELLERLEEHRHVADAVARLREPYRTTLLQRYVEDLTPTQMAARSGEPLSSVKTRLSRGLALLRNDLESARGPHWYAALLPLAQTEPISPSTSLSALVGHAMTLKQGLTLFAVALVALVGFLVWPTTQRSATTAPSHAMASEETISMAAKQLEPPSKLESPSLPANASSRSILSGTEPPLSADQREQAPAAPDAPVLTHIKVSVFTPFGKPLADALIQQTSLGGPLDPPHGSDSPPAQVHELGRTGPDGALAVRLMSPQHRSRLSVVASGLGTLVHGIVPEFTKGDYDVALVAGPVRVVDGVVTDETGSPVENATVGLFCFEDFSARIGLPMSMQEELVGSITTDTEGRFRFPASPECPQTYLRADAIGHEYDMVSAADRGNASVTIPLIRTRQGETALRGRVVCIDGSSPTGALVTLPPMGESVRVTSDDGRFELSLSPTDSDKVAVHATLAGFLPAVYEKPAGEAWPEDLLLEFGEQALAIRGTVVDHEGRPLEGIQVGVANGTLFGLVFDPGSTTSMRGQLVEDLAATSGTATCMTNEAGEFEIDGLLARAYTLFVLQPGTLRRTVSKPIEAGQSGVQLPFDLSEPSGPIAGRVTDRQGVPVTGFQVMAWRPYPLEGDTAAKRLPRLTTTTDADGRFRFEDCVYAGAALQCFGRVQFEAKNLSLSELGDPTNLEVVLARNSPFRIQWAGGAPPGEATSMRLEASGVEQVMLVRETSDGAERVLEFSIKSPATPVHYVCEGTYDVVLLSKGTETERFPVEIQGADLQVIVH